MSNDTFEVDCSSRRKKLQWFVLSLTGDRKLIICDYDKVIVLNLIILTFK